METSVGTDPGGETLCLISVRASSEGLGLLETPKQAQPWATGQQRPWAAGLAKATTGPQSQPAEAQAYSS